MTYQPDYTISDNLMEEIMTGGLGQTHLLCKASPNTDDNWRDRNKLAIIVSSSSGKRSTR